MIPVNCVFKVKAVITPRNKSNRFIWNNWPPGPDSISHIACVLVWKNSSSSEFDWLQRSGESRNKKKCNKIIYCIDILLNLIKDIFRFYIREKMANRI